MNLLQKLTEGAEKPKMMMGDKISAELRPELCRYLLGHTIVFPATTLWRGEKASAIA